MKIINTSKYQLTLLLYIVKTFFSKQTIELCLGSVFHLYPSLKQLYLKQLAAFFIFYVSQVINNQIEIAVSLLKPHFFHNVIRVGMPVYLCKQTTTVDTTTIVYTTVEKVYSAIL